MELRHYMQDGAGYQARAVLAALQGMGEIEDSWDNTFKCYKADIKVARWDNGREQGYVVSLRNSHNDQLNICFAEHRNSDAIALVKWYQTMLNDPNIDNSDYVQGQHVTNSFLHGDYVSAAAWVFDNLKVHWEAGKVRLEAVKPDYNQMVNSMFDHWGGF